jgi:uncharacterized protein (DUF924 family)
MDTEKITNILDYWFHPNNSNKHFGASPDDDKEITSKFVHFLEYPEPNLKDTTEPKELLSYVILYDQLVRHFYRNDNEEKIPHYHKKALEIATHMSVDEMDLSLNPEERCFLLLPFRHTFEKEYLEIVIEKIKEYRSEYDDSVADTMPSIYRRFWRATMLSYSQIVTDQLEPEELRLDISSDEIFRILDDGDDTRAVHNLEIIRNLSKSNIFYKETVRTLRELDKLGEYNGITISLSGGVDSMVCCFVLHHLLKGTGKDLIAVMIDYGNRDTCELEVEMVKRWCALLGIRLYVRHIKYLRRSRSSERNLYEEVTREIRFQMYKKFGYPVVLGHNYSDGEENILTNILKSQHFDNLIGMRTNLQMNILSLMFMIQRRTGQHVVFFVELSSRH